MRTAVLFALMSMVMLLASVFSWDWLDRAASLCALALFLYAIRHGFRTLTGILTAGLIVFFALLNGNALTPDGFLKLFQRNADVVLILVWSGLFGVPIVASGTTERFKRLVERLTPSLKKSLLYVITHGFGTMLTAGALRIMFDLNDVNRRLKREEANVAIMLQAFGGCVLWSPFISFLVLVLTLNHVNWLSYFPYGLVMVLVFTLLVAIQAKRTGRRFESASERLAGGQRPDLASRWREAGSALLAYVRTNAGFLAIWLGVFSEIFILSTRFGIAVSKLIILNCMVVPVLWAKKYMSWKEVMRSCLKNLDPAPYRHSIVLFVGAGVIAGLILRMDFGWLAWMVDEVRQVPLSGVLLVFLIFVLVLVPSFYGIHPIVIISIVCSLNYVHGWLSPLTLSVLCAGTIPIFNLSSPYSVQNQLLWSLFGRDAMTSLVRHHRGVSATWGVLLLLFAGFLASASV